MNNEDFNMNDAIKQKLTEALREGRRSPYHLKIEKYFKSLDNLIYIFQEWPIHEGHNARYHLQAFMAENDYKLELFSYVDEGSLIYSRFSDVEYAPNKYKSCIEDGTFFVTRKDNSKVTFMLHSRLSRYDRSYDIGIVCQDNNVTEVEKLLRQFKQYILDHNIYKGQKFHGDLSFIKQDKKYTWDDLIVEPKTLELLQQNLLTVLTKRDLYNKFGISAKRGIILSGPPGTGKTMIGKILCSTMPEWSFIWVSPGDLGRIETLKTYCHLAKMIAPTILFLEDLDLHFQSRDANPQNSMLGELMNQLDGIDDLANIVVIGTTNKIGDLEDALAKRPGRFDKIIKIDVPERSIIQKMYCQFGKDKISSKVDWEKVLNASEGLTGAQIKEVLAQTILKLIDSPSFDSSKPIQLGTKELLQGVKLSKQKDFSPKTMGFSKHGGIALGEPDFD
jgi:AAA+ superfamily predicted ATPase